MNEPVGLPSGTVVLATYHPRWAELYAAEAADIGRRAQELDVALSLEHMGSTAVPGLIAKPIIDILAGWYDARHRDVLIQVLEDAGYEHRGESGIPGREFFRRGSPRSYHVHLVERGGAFWMDHLVFRDLLRADPATAQGYAALKQDLAAKYPFDRPVYIDGKTSFVRESLVRARALGMYHDREA